ncbi:MAG: VWA domain-containing protein [Planctomycetota bacterium]|nr:VWA domain-containing protein [Planctomycetota bacterium]
MFEHWPSFRSPELLALAPAAGLAVWYASRRAAQPAAVFSSVADVRGLPVTLAQRARRAQPWLRAAALGFLVVALARPQQGIVETQVHAEGIAIEAALDTSGSMEALDFQLGGAEASRMEAVKRVFIEFVEGDAEAGLSGRPDDLIGLVSFGGYADSRCPLTLDHGALLEVVKSLDTPKPIQDRRGNVLNEAFTREEALTAIGDALALSLARLKDVQAKSKVIVLLSDGVNNAGVADPLESAKAAKALGIKVYTIGVGRTGEAKMLFKDRFGRTVPQMVNVELDEKLLKAIAEETAGRYYNAKDTDSLRKVYAEIDRLEKTETERRIYTDYHERFVLPLLVGVALLCFDRILSATRLRTLP